MAARPFSRPEARHLHAAERQFDRRYVVVIDPAGAGLQARDHAVRASQIVGEYAGRQAEFGGIGALDDFVLLFELEHRHHRAEYFLAHDGHVVATLIEYGRRHEDSRCARSPTVTRAPPVRMRAPSARPRAI